jgi:hypothetical protein
MARKAYNLPNAPETRAEVELILGPFAAPSVRYNRAVHALDVCRCQTGL